MSPCTALYVVAVAVALVLGGLVNALLAGLVVLVLVGRCIARSCMSVDAAHHAWSGGTVRH